MDKLEVFGARKLKGYINVSGSKNSSLPILAATILSNKKIHLTNLPKVKDIETMIKLLESIGSKVKYLKKKNSVLITNNEKIKTFAAYNLVKTMRAGILVLGPMLARFGKAKVSTPGGCSIGLRPIDIHLKSLAKLGVKYKISDGYVYGVNTRINCRDINILGNYWSFNFNFNRCWKLEDYSFRNYWRSFYGIII